MKVIADNYTVYFDTDETLIESESVSEDYKKQDGEIILEHPSFGKLRVLPKYEAIETLKEFSVQGDTVVVWHEGGTTWPNRVLKALKLTKYVDLVVAKPDLYFDDMPPEYILKNKGEIDE